MKNAILLGLLLFFINLSAQKSPYKWGEFSDQEIQMDVYPDDSSAAAVTLGKWGRFQTFYNDQQVTYYTYHFRKKILAEDGLDIANVSFQFNDSYKFSGLKAQTINYENGKAEYTKLEKSDFIKSKISKEISGIKFTFPKAKVGSIIEYKYNIIVENIFSLRPWYFQEEYPMVESIYEGVIPQYFSYVFMTQNAQNIETEQNNVTGRTRHKWVCKNLPAMKQEEYMPNILDYFTHIKFQLKGVDWPGQAPQIILSTWQSLSEELLLQSEFGSQLRIKVLKYFDTIDKVDKSLDPKTRVENIFNHIVNNYEWNGKLGIYPSNRMKELSSIRKGNGAALNFLLINALKELDIEAHPVLVSSVGNGQVFDLYPFTGQFNHTIAYVNTGEAEFLVDATANTRPFDMLPLRDINSIGFIVQKEGSNSWVDLRNVQSGNHTCSIVGELDSEGVFSGEYTYLDKGYEGYLLREKLANQTKEAYFAESMETEDGDYTFEEIVLENLKEPAQPLQANVKLQSPEFVSVINDFMYLNPMLNEGMDENPFQLKERQYPVDFAYPQSETYVLNLKLPEGYEVESIPDQLRITLPDKSISFSYSVSLTQQGGIQVLNRFNIKRSYFPPEEYEDLKSFFNMIVEKHAEQIVLKKM